MSLNPLQNAQPRAGAAAASLPQPYESSRRTNRRPNIASQKAEPVDNIGLFQPILLETTRRSNRTRLHREPEDIISMAPVSCRPSRSSSSRSSSPNSSESSGRTSAVSSLFCHQEEFPRNVTGTQTPQSLSPLQTSRPPSPPHPPVTKVFVPIPVETTRRSNKKPPPVNTQQPRDCSPVKELPPTPPDSVPLPSYMIPEPYEISRRSNRRPLARPLVPRLAEAVPKSNLTRKHEMDYDVTQLPQPFPAARMTNRILNPAGRHNRRNSTVQQHHGGPQPYQYLAHSAMVNQQDSKGSNACPLTHVLHLPGPIDSVPSSPNVSPKGSRHGSIHENHDPEKNSDEGHAGAARQSRQKCALGASISRMQISSKTPRTDGHGLSSIRASRIQEVKFKGRRDSEDDDDEEEVESDAEEDNNKPIRPTVNINIRGTQKRARDEADYLICASPTPDKFLAKNPATSKMPMLSNKYHLPDPVVGTGLYGGRYKIPAAGLYYGSNPQSQAQLYKPSFKVMPSPGITVASLPPRPATQIKSPLVPESRAEVRDVFVKEIYTYVGMDHECVARKFDRELADVTGMTIADVRKDRFVALKEYIKHYVDLNPTVEGGMKKGLW